MRYPRKHENSNGAPYPLPSNNWLLDFLPPLSSNGALDWGPTRPPTKSEFVSEVGWVGENQSVHKWWGSGSFCTRSRFSSLLQESGEEMGRCSRSQHQSLVLSIARTAKVCACSSSCLLRLLLFFPLSIFVTALKC
jgi:hypothetical protein